MSRAGNMVGSFIVEDFSTGPTKRPWTAEDAARLAGTFTIGGRLTKPHVNMPAGPYVIGAVSLWCTRATGERKDGSTIICARRNSRADDKTCRECGGAS